MINTDLERKNFQTAPLNSVMRIIDAVCQGHHNKELLVFVHPKKLKVKFLATFLFRFHLLTKIRLVCQVKFARVHHKLVSASQFS